MAMFRTLFSSSCVFLLIHEGKGCSNFLVSKGASVDGSTMIAYNADSDNLFGSLGHYPAATHAPGTMRDIFDWDSGLYLGQIKEANVTFNVVGNMNEFGLTIGETTFGGLSAFNHQPGAIMDYGNLIWVTLQRAKTAREAIKVAASLMDEYGYASDGESFSIGDPNEVWLMEIFSKGPGEKGAVWVASRVPDGYVCAHANQARTTTFAQNDPENVLYAEDVVTFAQRKGLYPNNGDPTKFDFSGTYDPISFTSARLAEARAWNIFYRAGVSTIGNYLEYAKGYDLANRMPLFFKPGYKISVNDTMWIMRTHFEGTWFDNSGVGRPDVGAESQNSVYRWRPLVWQSGGKSFLNERTVGVQQTAWNFVAHMRSWMPLALSGVMWWSPDDSSMSLRVPVYSSSKSISTGYGDPYGQVPPAAVVYGVNASAAKMSMDSAFWVWNLVANYAYDRSYASIFPIVQERIIELETLYFADVAAMDKRAMDIIKTNPSQAVDLVTNFSVTTQNQAIVMWRNFWMELFTQFRDGFNSGSPKLPTCSGAVKTDCTSRPIPDSSEPGYSDAWYARIVADSNNAEKYGIPKNVKLDMNKIAAIDKKTSRRTL